MTENRNPIIDIHIHDDRWQSCSFPLTETTQTAASNAYDGAKLPAALSTALNNFNAVTLSVVLSDAQAVRVLNKTYRGKDKTTNILSFPAWGEDEDLSMEDIHDENIHLGDLMLCYDTLTDEAETMKISVKDHYKHLIIHGTLHLLGYDHEDNQSAAAMESLEIKLLDKLGVKNPYE